MMIEQETNFTSQLRHFALEFFQMKDPHYEHLCQSLTHQMLPCMTSLQKIELDIGHYFHDQCIQALSNAADHIVDLKLKLEVHNLDILTIISQKLRRLQSLRISVRGKKQFI